MQVHQWNKWAFELKELHIYSIELSDQNTFKKTIKYQHKTNKQQKFLFIHVKLYYVLCMYVYYVPSIYFKTCTACAHGVQFKSYKIINYYSIMLYLYLLPSTCNFTSFNFQDLSYFLFFLLLLLRILDLYFPRSFCWNVSAEPHI